MCERCGGTGFVVKDVPLGHPDFGRAIGCDCMSERRRALAQRKLEALDGLAPSERLHRFADTQPNPAQASACAHLAAASAGMYTLQGAPGLGKSHFLHCVVNQAREAGRVAVYTTMPDVLDYLRAAFNPNMAREGFDERWHLLVECEVLALDELDEFNETAWAKERFLRLVDERWRYRETRLTVAALNGSVTDLPPKVASRLLSGVVLHLEGRDLRQMARRDLVPA